MSSDKGPGTSFPTQECCRDFPEILQVEDIYRAKALGLPSPDALFCLLGPLLQEGDRY